MAATTTAIALAGAAGSGISQVGSAYAESQALRAQGDYQKNVMDANARWSRKQADDAELRGGREAARIRKKASHVIGQQRVAYAGQGVEINAGGSARDIEEDTLLAATDAVITAKNNSYREAFGFRSEALAYESRGRSAAKAGRSAGRLALISGLSKASRTAATGAYFYSKDPYLMESARPKSANG